MAAADGIVDALAARGWWHAADFVDPPPLAELVAGLRARDSAGEFRPAAIGAGAARSLRPDIRGDRIAWLHEPRTAAERELFARLDALRETLNRDLQLGLHALECHYASYAPGARYDRHLDRSPRGAERVVSLVLYLNEDWQPEDGGILRLHASEGAVNVVPRGGTLVAFLSEKLEHEVLPARRERLSLAGWFRRRGGGAPF